MVRCVGAHTASAPSKSGAAVAPGFAPLRASCASSGSSTKLAWLFGVAAFVFGEPERQDTMLRDRLHASLKHLGINDSNYKVLKLLPLIYVAWADGRIEPAQEQRLLDFAHNYFAIGAHGERLLKRWIAERPTKEYIREGLHDLLLLAHAPDDWGFDVDELHGLLAFSEAIARTTAEAMDAPTSVGADEEQALREIARELHIDDGESWAALLRDLYEDQERDSARQPEHLAAH